MQSDKGRDAAIFGDNVVGAKPVGIPAEGPGIRVGLVNQAKINIEEDVYGDQGVILVVVDRILDREINRKAA